VATANKRREAHQLAAPQEKLCGRCGKVKALAEFSRDSRNKKDSLKYRCKKCDKEIYAEYTAKKRLYG
jgi:predicted RNA-binding Zn-ribbon protein involved in translation (DUF1610 family)